MKTILGAKPKTITPISLVVIIPVKTVLPISNKARLALSGFDPVYFRNEVMICIENSTASPTHITKFTTETAFTSVS